MVRKARIDLLWRVKKGLKNKNYIEVYQNMENIIKLSEFDPKKIILKDPKANKAGGIAIPVKYMCPRRGEIPFLLKTPKVDLPFGASQWPTKENSKGVEDTVKYSLAPVFTGHHNDWEGKPKVKMLHDKLAALETHIHKTLFKNSMKYLKKKYSSISSVEDKCNPIIRPGKTKGELDPSKPPGFKINLDRDKKEDKTQLNTFGSMTIFDKSNQKVVLDVNNVNDTFQWSSATRGLIGLFTLFVVNGNISMPIRAKQLLAYPGVSNITKNVFEDDSDAEDDDSEPVKPAEVENVLADSDEDESEDVVEEAPAPKAKKEKKEKKAKVEVVDSSSEEEEVEVELSEEE
jgi:hypothetical protein